MWTYSGDPTLSARDEMRFLLGDTVEAQAVFSDEEIDYLLTQSSNVYLAAALGAETAASMYVSSSNGSVSTKTVGALSISYDDASKASEYRKLASDLRKRAALTGVVMAYSGGTSKADKETMRQNTDWDQPYFRRGMNDNPDAGSVPEGVTYITYP